MNSIDDLVCHFEQLNAEGLSWEFNEHSERYEEFALTETLPGQLVSALLAAHSEKSVGLLTVFAAWRSLVGWFFYCDDDRPLRICNGLESYWTCIEQASIPDSWLDETVPLDSGIPIVDCRWDDTSSASSAVCHAARFARSRRPIDAVIGISNAWGVFTVSPVGRSRPFSEWLVKVALRAAIEQRALTTVERMSKVDFSYPEIMQWE